jgi:serine/threonine-protein phosphatase PGAM5
MVALLLASTARAADPPPAPGIRYVYLIRHGFYDRDSLDERVGSRLNALGHEQARLLGARLKGLPVTFGALVTSDFTRARETADDLGAILGMKPALDSLIHECTPRGDRYMSSHPPAEVALCDSNLNAAFRKYMTPSPSGDAHDLLVCHGNVIRWMVSKALGMDTMRWPNLELGNASLTIVAVRPDGETRLVMYSDVGHLPVDKQTWTGKGAGWTRTPSRPTMR